MTVLDKETCAQVAMVKGHFRPSVLAAHAVRTALEYNNALTGVERENHGHAVLQEIERLGKAKLHSRGGWLYWFDKPSDVWKNIDDRERQARIGWSTNERTRPILLEDLRSAIDDETMDVRSRGLLEEYVTFRMQSNAKFAADS